MHLKDKTNLDYSLYAQREYMKKTKRYFLQDNDDMDPKEFHDTLVGLNNLLLFIEPLNTSVHLPNS